MVWEVLLVLLVWEVWEVILVWEVVLRQPPSVVAALDQSEATKSRKQGNLLQGVPHHHTAMISHNTTKQHIRVIYRVFFNWYPP